MFIKHAPLLGGRLGCHAFFTEAGQHESNHNCMAGVGPNLKSCFVHLLLLLLQALLQVVQVVWGLPVCLSCGAGSTHQMYGHTTA